MAQQAYEHGEHRSPPSIQSPSNGGFNQTMSPSIAPFSDNPGPPDIYDETEELDSEEIEDFEDAESVIGPSMSRAASRLKHPNTPAVEKRNALAEALAYFDQGPETPPSELFTGPMDFDDGPDSQVSESAEDRNQKLRRMSQQGRSMTLGNLPLRDLDNNGLPSPWYADPKSPTARQTAPQPSLQGVFSKEVERKRSMSGGSTSLKSFLPKGFPSMAQVGNMFGSTHTNQTTRSGGPSSPRSPYTRKHYSPPGVVSPTQQHLAPEPQGPQPRRPATIRRSTSDDSLLYHSLSRSSSLGDDSLFENQRLQVNSRAKAIRDSFQDRSSFRMPNMPSMPTMPSFAFNLNFLNTSDAPARKRSHTDGSSDILASNIMKKIPTPITTSSKVGTNAPNGASSDSTIPDPAKGNRPKLNYLDRALETLTGDVVVMGGYRGSILRATKSNRQVWAPVKVGLNIRKVDLAVGLEPEDEERMQETIYPAGMLQNIGPVDISKRLFKRLGECENSRNGKLRVWDYGYDWRLSPHLLARKLTEFLEKLPSNQPPKDGSQAKRNGALVIAHSLGGLITRHVVNKRPELFSGVVYAGTPQSCINILGPLRNGDAVLLSQRVLTAQVNFTLRTSFVLLPESGACFVDIKTKEKYPMDFFDVNTWIKYRLSPCIEQPLPPRLPATGLLANLSVSGSMLSIPLPGKKGSPPISASSSSSDLRNDAHNSRTTRAADALRNLDHGNDRTIAPQMGNKPMSVTRGHTNSVSMTVTIPREKAIAYLTRTLAETKRFKQELYFRPELSEANAYPPLALIYGKSIPTCCGAKVDGLEGIPCSDVYDNLAFAAGDGVTLAKEAMLPEGYKAALGGRIRSDRGHVTLLGDLNAVGRAIEAVQKGRAKGIGLGV